MKIAQANAGFAYKLYREVVSEAARKNIIFSPLGISSAFSMLSLGAKSTTQTQLLSGLGFNLTEINEREIHEGFRDLLNKLNSNVTEIELSVGDALFKDKKWNPQLKFVLDTKKFYQADILSTIFKNPEETEETINSYIEKKTHGKLVHVVKKLDPLTVVVLVNYIFFKAYWESPFSPDNTRDEDFHVNRDTTVKVPMMNRISYFKSYYDADLSCRVVQLPYKGGATALFILPDPGKVKQVEDALGNEVLRRWVNSLRESKTQLYLPKFSISSTYVLKRILRRLGITDVFTGDADLSGISREPGLYVTKAIHNACLNVYENGTEAAATTVFEDVPISFPLPHVPIVKFNRPFIMMICDEPTKSILFMGKVKNPKESLLHN
ncbi:alpha-1-antiproteinase 2-like [Elgaria multicarinata webbii]|uniref:alpha-1-antiproteinase 2-like n=1 Tax=Elgaria multicarinata webbii TaxID=159646 RepID=UPI002FCD5C75